VLKTIGGANEKPHSLRQTHTILSIFYLRKVKFSLKYSIKEYRLRNDVEVYDAALLSLLR
jgi:hypothetical protein